MKRKMIEMGDDAELIVPIKTPYGFYAHPAPKGLTDPEITHVFR